MNTTKLLRPSPAMVIAVVALALALAGTAVAGTDGLTSKITKAKVKSIAKKQANKAITRREASLNVNSAKTADSATNATNAVTGAARAYALVDSDGTVLPTAPSREITSSSITIPPAGTGFYCFDLAFTPVTAAANEADGASGINDGVMTFTFVKADYQHCPATAEAEVAHFDTSSNAYSTDPYYIQFDG